MLEVFLKEDLPVNEHLTAVLTAFFFFFFFSFACDKTEMKPWIQELLLCHLYGFRSVEADET